ncbi:hypothetical protein [Embleya sp. NPDC020630]|uniref:hypothetical protein n=1 Tax=Embleya sp. NPDC020630 TaxID=3363979 RepID=UPI00378D143F
MCAGDLRAVGLELPGLIAELTATVHEVSTDGRERGYAVLAGAFRTAYDVTTKLGYHDLCGVALDRMEWAAKRASDPVLVAIRQYLRALAYLRSGRYERGSRLHVSGRRVLEQADQDAVETIAVSGRIHALVRQYPADGAVAPVWLRMLPIGSRVEHLPARVLVGTAAEVHDWFTECRALLVEDGWRIGGPVRADVEVVDPSRLVS